MISVQWYAQGMTGHVQYLPTKSSCKLITQVNAPFSMVPLSLQVISDISGFGHRAGKNLLLSCPIPKDLSGTQYKANLCGNAYIYYRIKAFLCPPR